MAKYGSFTSYGAFKNEVEELNEILDGKVSPEEKDEITGMLTEVCYQLGEANKICKAFESAVLEILGEKGFEKCSNRALQSIATGEFENQFMAELEADENQPAELGFYD